MDLQLRFFATFRQAVGTKTIERSYPDDATIGDVLAGLEREFADLDDRLLNENGIRPQLSVFKNGRNVVHQDGVETAVTDGDVVSVFPPVAGGSRAPRRRVD